MADSFFGLPEKDRKAALERAASRLGRREHILEKDIWVVWTLQTLFAAPFGGHLVFKGGTSLSKAHRVIRRFSEDVDITVDIRAVIPELVEKAGGVIPPSRSQAKKWTDEVRGRLPVWIDEKILPCIKNSLSAAGLKASLSAPEDSEGNVLIDYEKMFEGEGYIKPYIQLEFGARSTGEPSDWHDVSCDAAAGVSGVEFPAAKPRVMKAERTFWEKAAAVHVYCLKGAFRGRSGYARHWHDLMRLDDAGVSARAFEDIGLAADVAEHKSWFFAEKDVRGGAVDYHAAVAGALRLVPEGGALDALRKDYGAMTASGMFFEDPGTFDALMERCAALETRANQK